MEREGCAWVLVRAIEVWVALSEDFGLGQDTGKKLVALCWRRSCTGHRRVAWQERLEGKTHKMDLGAIEDSRRVESSQLCAVGTHVTR